MTILAAPPQRTGQRPDFLMTHFTKRAERQFEQLYRDATPDDREHLIWALANPVRADRCELIRNQAKRRTFHFPVRGRGAPRVSFQQLDHTTCCVVDASKHDKFDAFAVRDHGQYGTLSTVEEVMTHCQTDARKPQPLPPPAASQGCTVRASGSASEHSAFLAEAFGLVVEELVRPQVAAVESRLTRRVDASNADMASIRQAVKDSATGLQDLSASQREQFASLAARVETLDSEHAHTRSALGTVRNEGMAALQAELSRTTASWHETLRSEVLSHTSPLAEDLDRQCHRLGALSEAFREFTTTLTARLERAGVDALSQRVDALGEQFAHDVRRLQVEHFRSFDPTSGPLKVLHERLQSLDNEILGCVARQAALQRELDATKEAMAAPTLFGRLWARAVRRASSFGLGRYVTTPRQLD